MDTPFTKLTEADLANYIGKEVISHQLKDIRDYASKHISFIIHPPACCGACCM